MMRKLLMVTSMIEISAGVVLLAVPAMFVSILLGSTLDTPASSVVARVAGAALLSFGVACGSACRDSQSRAAIGIAAAMLFYNIAVFALLIAAKYGAGLTGVGLWPAIALHAALAVWCLACLRTAWPRKRWPGTSVDQGK